MSASYLAERRAHILDAAARCFAREGFHRATMQHIVREAGLSPGAIYRYFASKEDMIAAIAAERHAAERELFPPPGTEGQALPSVAALARAFLSRLGRPGEREWRRVTVQLWGEALRNPRVLDVVRDGLQEPLRRLAALLRAGQRDGSVAPDVDPAATARVAAAVFEGLVLQQAWDPHLDVGRFVRAAVRLLEGLAPPRRPLRRGRSRRAQQ